MAQQRVREKQIEDLDAGKVTTGQFVDGRISESSVKQYAGTDAGDLVQLEGSPAGLPDINGSTLTGIAYDVATFYASLVSDVNAEVLRFEVPRQITIPAGFAGSQAESRTVAAGTGSPLADAVFSIRRDGSEIGTVSFSTGSSTGTFSVGSPAGPFTFTPGQVLTVVALTADSNQEDISIVIKAEVS